jgi:hypothetical protein
MPKLKDRSQESEVRSQHDAGYTIYDACSKTIIHRRGGEEAKENKFFWIDLHIVMCYRMCKGGIYYGYKPGIRR